MRTKPKQISCGQLGVAVESMRIVGSASRRLDKLLGELQNCQIEIAEGSFEAIQFHLDKIHRDLQPIPLQYAESR